MHIVSHDYNNNNTSIREDVKSLKAAVNLVDVVQYYYALSQFKRMSVDHAMACVCAFYAHDCHPLSFR